MQWINDFYNMGQILLILYRWIYRKFHVLQLRLFFQYLVIKVIQKDNFFYTSLANPHHK